MMRCTLAVLLLLLLPLAARAEVERFAVLIGNNYGAAGEEPLRYAEQDATRVYEVLTQLGEFAPTNAVLLRGLDATAVRSALLSMNERIRDVISTPGKQAVLVVYYSGHADAEHLHLGGTSLALEELSQIARGSAASFRLVVLDACRSGALTRVKGGRRAPAFTLPPSALERLPEDGFAFLTASAANEDAQESDALEGALFTHALLTGLLGAADADRDGAVILDEAYRYAYEATLRATSRTAVGTQHPTFQYALRGRGHLVLTYPARHAQGRAAIEFPNGLAFLLLRGGAHGDVAVELGGADVRRTLSLPPGRYFLRARAPDVMYEGEIEAAAGSSSAIDVRKLERIDYAQLVRKGARESQRSQALLAGLSVRSELPNGSAPCSGGFVGYQLDVSRFGARAKLGFCASQLANETLAAAVFAYDLSASAYHAWDVGRFSVETGLGGGVSVFEQRFETRGAATDQRALFPFTALHVGSDVHLQRGLFATLQLSAETHFLRMRERATAERLRIGFAVRPTLGFGKQF